MSCDGCPLSGPACKGVGPDQADLVIVGEAPGRQEIQAGTPFTGPSGKLLDATLADLGGSRAWTYVTNATMCRPPVDKDGKDTPPSKAALAACHDRLVDEVKARKPKVVLAVGGTASQVLLNTTDGITKTQGAMRWNEELGTWVIATYHPAAVLHGNTGYFDDIYDTTKRALQLTRGEIPFPDRNFKLDWHYVDDPAEAIKVLNHLYASATKIAFDTESKTKYSTGPRPLDDEWIMSQFYAGGDQAWAFNMPAMLHLRPFREALQKLFDKNGVIWRMHNSAYDRQVIRAGRFRSPKIVRDSMVLGLGLTERGEQVGLKVLSRTYLNAGYYEDLGDYSWTKGPQHEGHWRDLAKYGCQDVYYTFHLCDLLPPLVEAEGTMPLCKGLLTDATDAFADLEFRGSGIDMEYAAKLEDEWLPIIEEAERTMQDWAASKGFPLEQSFVGAQVKEIPCPVCSNDVDFVEKDRKLWRKEFETRFSHDPSCTGCMKRRFKLVPDERLNVRSSKQLQHLAFDILKMKHPERKRSTEEVFLAYNETSDFTKLLRNIRERDHLLRNYIRGIGDDVGPDGRVHPDFLLFGTITGRLSIRNPPLQTLPKWGVNPKMAKMVRRMFKARPGHVIVDVDYKNLELFIAWHYSGDENLGRALTEQDFHTATAAAVFNKSYAWMTDPANKQEAGDLRFNSKFVTFGIAYGRQAYSLAQGELKALTGGSEQLAQQYIDRFWALYPKYQEVYNQWQRDALTVGELRTPLGRVRRWRLITPDKVNHIKNQAVNFPIQSLASDTCLSALIRLNKRLPAAGLGDVLFTVHDSLVFEVPEDRLHEAIAVIKEEMTTPPYETHIKLFVDVEYGPTLGDVQPYVEPVAA